MKRKGPELGWISPTLKGALQQHPQAREYARKCFDHDRRECERIASMVDDLSTAHSLQAAVDERVATMLTTSPHAPFIACRKGCAHCCHQHVDVTRQEAKLLHAVGHHAIDEGRLQRQAEKTPDTWHELAPEDRACVFLGEDNACRVYEYRPMGCRKYLVRDDPDQCDTVKNPGAAVPIVFSPEAEIFASAAMTTFGAASMPRLLMKLRRKGKA